MIVSIIPDKEYIEKTWKKDSKKIYEYIDTVAIGDDGTPYYYSHVDIWIDCGVAKNLESKAKLITYSYANHSNHIDKYLEKYKKDNETYIACLGVFSREYEKPWKHGYFIDKNGVQTGNDYWDYESTGKEDEEWEYDDYFVNFLIFKVTLKDEKEV